MPPYEPKSGRVIVQVLANPDAGASEKLTTPTALYPCCLPVLRCDVTALPTNTGTIWIGDRDVCAIAGMERGAPLGSNEQYTIPESNLKDWYVDASVADEGVAFLAEIEVP